MKLKIILIAACAVLLSACTMVSAEPPLASTPTVEAPTTMPSVVPTAVQTLPTTAATSPPTTAPLTNPTRSAAITSEACTNPFYPISANAQWQYQISAPSVKNATVALTKSISNITPNSFVERRVLGGTSIDTNWTCANHALTATQLVDLSALTLNQIKLVTTKENGVTIPRPEELEIGTTWTNSFDVNGQLATNLIDVSGTGKADFRNKIVKEESVQVPAGTFRAFRVDSTIDIKLNGTAGQTSAPIELTIVQSAWFARDVGLVKSTMTIASEVVSTEVVSTNLTPARVATAAPKTATRIAPTQTPKSTPGGTMKVSIKNTAFNPSTITVRVGTTVDWENDESGSTQHTVTSGTPNAPSGMFDSGELNRGQHFQFTFSTPGTFNYFCRIHGAEMTGVVVVTQ